MSIPVLQSSWWERESWLLCLICLPGVSWWLSGSSSRCHGVVCSLWLWYFLIILTYYFWHSEAGLSPLVKYFTDRSKAVPLLWIYMFFLSCVCYAFVRVCLYVPCGHLLGKGWPLSSRLWYLLWVCHFPIGILGQVDYIDSRSLHWWSLNGRNKLVWPSKYAHSSFSSLVQSSLPKDILLRTYLTSLQMVTGTVLRR